MAVLATESTEGTEKEGQKMENQEGREGPREEGRDGCRCGFLPSALLWGLCVLRGFLS
jgi:hypothetical protein